MAKKLKTVVVYRGDTWIRNWSITKKTHGLPVDFTGATARLQVKTDVENEEAVIEATTVGGDDLYFVEPLDSGKLRLEMSAEKTALLLPYTEYVFDIEVTFPNGFVKTYEKALLEIEPDCTRTPAP